MFYFSVSADHMMMEYEAETLGQQIFFLGCLQSSKCIFQIGITIAILVSPFTFNPAFVIFGPSFSMKSMTRKATLFLLLIVRKIKDWVCPA